MIHKADNCEDLFDVVSFGAMSFDADDLGLQHQCLDGKAVLTWKEMAYITVLVVTDLYRLNREQYFV